MVPKLWKQSHVSRQHKQLVTTHPVQEETIVKDRLMWAGLKKAFQPPTHMALLKKKTQNIKLKTRKKVLFLMNWEFLVLTRKKKEKFLLHNIFCGCSACTNLLLPIILLTHSFSKFFTNQWSNDKMLIDWVWSGWIGKFFTLGHDAQHRRHCAQSVHHDHKPNTFLSSPPTTPTQRSFELDSIWKTEQGIYLLESLQLTQHFINIIIIFIVVIIIIDAVLRFIFQKVILTAGWSHLSTLLMITYLLFHFHDWSSWSEIINNNNK